MARRTLREILASENHDAVHELVLQAQDPETEPETRATINLRFLEFLFPKLKQVELKGDLVDSSDFLALRELLTSYRAWKRDHGLPLAGALPEGPPAEPFTEEVSGPESRVPSQEPPPSPAAPPRSNGATKPNGKVNGKKHHE